MADDFGLLTRSRLRVWYLIYFKGYRVARKASEPRIGWFGRINYDNRWWLEKTR